MHAEIDGDRLTEQEMGSFFILLVAAGNETTRNAISHGMKALCDYPDQRRIWQQDFDRVAPTAVEEIVRWARPVIFMRRSAVCDTEIGGTTIREGDKLLLFYPPRTATRRCSADPSASTCGATRTTTSASAADRTSASARTSRGARSP